MRTRYLRIVAGGLVAAIAICGGASASSTLPALQSGGGGGNAADLDPAVTRRIDADVQQVMQRFQVPGAAIAVIVDGKPLYSRAYGLRDRERALLVRTDTPFEIGSITKQFTAAAIVQLQEAGKVQLDDPLARYLPHAPHASEVTLRHLLTHTSGLHEYFDGPEAEVDDLVTRPIDFDDLIAHCRPAAGFPARHALVVFQHRLRAARQGDRKRLRRALPRLPAAAHAGAAGHDPHLYPG